MSKKYVFMCAAVFLVVAQHHNLPSSTADAPEKVPAEMSPQPIDALKVMTRVDERSRGEDSIATVTWTLMKKGRVQHRAKYTEKRKNYGGKEGFNYKSVIRYSEPPKIYKKALLTWIYTNGKRGFRGAAAGQHCRD